MAEYVNIQVTCHALNMTQSMFQIMMQKKCEPIILLDAETQWEKLLIKYYGHTNTCTTQKEN